MIEIDEDGLDEMDKRILESVIYKFNGGPVGLSSVAVAVPSWKSRSTSSIH